MKHLLTALLCLTLIAALFLPVAAHEGHDHETTQSVPAELDLDCDGVPDYMDALIDVDGDGIADAGPTYQQPPKESKIQPKPFPWVWIVGIVFFGMVLATLGIVISKKKKAVEANQNGSDTNVSDQ